MRERHPLLPPTEPTYEINAKDAKILHDLGIDPEFEEDLDKEYDDLFNFMDDLRRRRGEGVLGE